MTKISDTASINRSVLKRYRKQRGHSQQSLADKVGMSRSYLADLERGRKKSPRMTVVERIAQALGIDVNELL